MVTINAFSLFAELALDDKDFNRALDRAERRLGATRQEADRTERSVEEVGRTSRTTAGDVNRLDGTLDKAADGFDKVEREARDTDRTLDRMGGPNGSTNKAGKGITALVGSLRSFAAPALAAAGAIWGAQGLARGLTRMASEAERASNATLVFEKQLERSNIDTAEASGVVDRLAERFGVLPQTVQEATTLMLRAGGSMEDVERALTAAGASAAATGFDISQAFDNVSTAVATGRSELLETSGIVANLGPVAQEYASSVGKTVDELTEQELVQARVNAIYQESRAEIEDVDELLDGLVGTQAKARTEWAEFRQELGTLLMPVIQGAIGMFAELLGHVNDWIDTWRGGRAREATTAIETVRDRVKEFGEQSTTTAAALDTLTEATTEDGFKGALDTLITTLDEDGQAAMRDFADSHVLPLVAAGNLQDAVELSVKEVMRLRLEAAEAAQEANEITSRTLEQRERQLEEHVAAYERVQQRYEEGRRIGGYVPGDPQYEAAFEREMQGYADTQIELRGVAEALSEVRDERAALQGAVNVLTDDLNALESGAMTAEEYVAKLRESLAELNGTRATAGVDVTPDGDNPDATPENPTGLPGDGEEREVIIAVRPAGGRWLTGIGEEYAAFLQGAAARQGPSRHGPYTGSGVPRPDRGDGGLGRVRAGVRNDLYATFDRYGTGAIGGHEGFGAAVEEAIAQNARDGLLEGYDEAGRILARGTRGASVAPVQPFGVGNLFAAQEARDQAIFDAAWGGTTPADYRGGQYGMSGAQQLGNTAGDRAFNDRFAGWGADLAFANDRRTGRGDGGLGDAARLIEEQEKAAAQAETAMQKLQDRIADMSGTAPTQFDKMRTTVEEFGRASGATDEEIAAMLAKIDELEKSDALVNTLSDVSGVLSEIGGAAGGRLGEMLSGMGELVDIGKQLASGDVLGAVTAIATELVSAFTAASEASKALEEELAAIDSRFALISTESLVKTTREQVGSVFGIIPIYGEVVDEAASEFGLTIAQSIEEGMMSGLRQGMEAYLETGNIEDLEAGIEGGLRTAVTNALFESLINEAIIKGALGPLLTQLTEAFAAGDREEANRIANKINDMIPGLAKDIAAITSELDYLQPTNDGGDGGDGNTGGTNTGSDPSLPDQSFGGTPQGVQLAVAVPLVDAAEMIRDSIGRLLDTGGPLAGLAGLNPNVMGDFTGALRDATPVLDRLADGIDVRLGSGGQAPRGSRTAYLRGA